jgi:hypothetical protein
VATLERADAANQALEATRSLVRLADPGETLTVEGQTLHLLRPRLELPQEATDPDSRRLRNANRSGELALWADCGRAAGAVMGNPEERDHRVAQYHTSTTEFARSTNGDPSVPSSHMWPVVMRDFLAAHRDISTKYHLDEKRDELAEEAARNIYWKTFDDDERRAFDLHAGVNTAVDPSVGEAYAIGNDAHDKDKGTWNMHWGGVVLEAGGDNVTLENFAVALEPDDGEQQRDDKAHNDALRKRIEKAHDTINRDWEFKMYGTEEPEQTFHHQEATSGSFGSMPTTYETHVGKAGKSRRGG